MVIEHYSNNKKILFAILGLLLLGGVVYFARSDKPSEVYCTQEAMLCPDGSYVGRTGPNCEFAACPPLGDNWQAYSDGKISFQYPETLFAEYISTVDWPPRADITEGPFACTEAGSPEARAGETKVRMVDNRIYCVTEVTGAAAGSMYIQYAYAAPKGDKVLIFTFSLRFPQCANYEDPQKTACENEQGAFDLDGLMDRIARSAELR